MKSCIETPDSLIDQALTDALNDADSSSETDDFILIPSANPQKLASIPTITQDGTSCAYHALKNADDILRILKNPKIVELHLQENVDFEAIATQISDALRSEKSKAKAETLFNEKEKSGTWRDMIKTKRLPNALKDSIYEKLLQSVPHTDEQKTEYANAMETYKADKEAWVKRNSEHGYHKKDRAPRKPELKKSLRIDSTVKTYLKDIAQVCAAELANNNNSIDITNTDTLQDILINLIRTHNASALKDREDTYKGCIALLDSEALEQNFGKEITAETALKHNNGQIRELFGNDLDADELDYLLNHGNIENADNISIIARTETSPFVAGNAHALDQILETVKAKIKENDTCYHAFLIRQGFMGPATDDPQGSTHWITLVLYRFKGENYWIIADSSNPESGTTLLNKNNRTNDEEIAYLIAMVES